ncbi:hypothetical protein ACPHXT_000737 [Vibrio alginolyticus]
MKTQRCTWEVGDTSYRLRSESRPMHLFVWLQAGDLTFAATNPISISIHLEQLTVLGEKFYTLTLGDLTLCALPEAAAKDIAKVLDCELCERCEKCGKEAELEWDETGEYMFICDEC